LARVYGHLGRYAEAEPLLKRALAIREKSLAATDPQVATALSNLAELYRAQGRYAEAEPLWERALHIDEKALAPDDRHIATDLNNLALLYYVQGRYAEAEPLDLSRAHALYKGLLGDAGDLIKGKHLLIVPAGALTTLPFQVLVTTAPPSNDPASAAWLIRDHAITVLPSVASLAALRRTAKPSTAAKPMIGFGNPLLDGDQNNPQGGAYYKQLADMARSQIGCAAAPEQRTALLRAPSRSFAPVSQTAGIADLAELKRQTPLPETADELCAVARSLDADTGEIRIGKYATETEIKRVSTSGDLARYRILHFATHGVLAGQLSGTREPGLILTPPATATADDDGYLSGSEIAALKLDAEWVILSACNTAGGAGQGEAAEALSGLARVFFYAGARALLVSHWAVDSAATVKLITTAIGALAKDKSLGRAEGAPTRVTGAPRPRTCTA
jgi:CHAT domain-containing protein